jgi:NACHT domain-containing protein
MYSQDDAHGSTTAVGDQFEDEVAAALKLVPGAAVEQRRRIAGKAVDIILTVRGKLGAADTIIAVECKDYERRLTRNQVADILKDYYPLISKNVVQAVTIVTRRGIVENAADCLDGRSTRHMTYRQVLSSVVDLSPLAHEMRELFYVDNLNQYYDPPLCMHPNYDFAKSNYGKYVNPFADFVVNGGGVYYKEGGLYDSTPRLDLKSSKIEWQKFISRTKRSELLELANDYDEDLLAKVVQEKRSPTVGDLNNFVTRWLDDEDTAFGLAILGSYGTGKSTYARYLAHNCAQRYIRGETERVPLFIELRRFSSDQDIESLVTHELVNRNGVEGATFARFQSLNRLGMFVLILDGLDEMKFGMTREALAHNLSELNRLNTGASKVIICGRPTVFIDSLDQYSMLQAPPESSIEHGARYLPITIAPMKPDRILPVATAYANAMYATTDTGLDQKLVELKRELRRNSELRELLSRPVHIPMLLKVLPQLPKKSLMHLRRGGLYLQFIKKTIEREVSKRSRAGSSISAQQRFDFAARLACEMANQGDVRAISISAIPDSLFEPFRHPGRSLESIKMDMRSACFLELKPPDILYFGHKSYCEFLIAYRLLLNLRNGEPTDALSALATNEVLSFVLSLATTTDFDLATQHLPDHHALIFGIILRGSFETEYEGRQRKELVRRLFDRGGTSHFMEPTGKTMPRELIDSFLEVCLHFEYTVCRKPYALKALQYLILHEDDKTAVSAARLLPYRLRPNRRYLQRLIGQHRYEVWKQAEYIDNRLLGKNKGDLLN